MVDPYLGGIVRAKGIRRIESTKTETMLQQKRKKRPLEATASLLVSRNELLTRRGPSVRGREYLSERYRQPVLH